MIVRSVACACARSWGLLGTCWLPADEPRIATQGTNLLQKLDDGGGGRLLQTWLVSQQLVHRIAKVGGSVTERVSGPPASHGRKVICGEQDLEQPLKAAKQPFKPAQTRVENAVIP